MARLLICALLAAGGLLAQLNRGTITGNVTDSSGSAIPNVKVTATSAGTGQSTTTTSNEFGQYSLPNLVTGTYKLLFESPNFKRSVREGVELGVTQVLRIDVALEVGSVIEVVSVTSALPKLQTDSPEVGTSLDNKQLLELPLTFSGARLAENFAYKVTPGVSSNNWTSNINGSTAFSKETPARRRDRHDVSLGPLRRIVGFGRSPAGVSDSDQRNERRVRTRAKRRFQLRDEVRPEPDPRVGVWRSSQRGIQRQYLRQQVPRPASRQGPPAELRVQLRRPRLHSKDLQRPQQDVLLCDL